MQHQEPLLYLSLSTALTHVGPIGLKDLVIRVSLLGVATPFWNVLPFYSSAWKCADLMRRCWSVLPSYWLAWQCAGLMRRFWSVLPSYWLDWKCAGLIGFAALYWNTFPSYWSVWKRVGLMGLLHQGVLVYTGLSQSPEGFVRILAGSSR